MPSNADSLDLNQPAGTLSEIAEQERKKLFARNDYGLGKDLYSSTHPNAMANGDLQGKGTGEYLDVYNPAAGSSLDIAERISDIVNNKYQADKPYTAPPSA